MEEIFAPWRIEWVRREIDTPDGCIFCIFRDEDLEEDRENLVVARGNHSYVMLNRHPYNPGHAMVVPDRHTGSYDELDDEELLDHARMKQRTFRALRSSFEPDGFNTGLNLGSGSGGSIDDHIHTHVVPRWNGDTNFMATTADTKVIVQQIKESYDELREGFAELERAEDDKEGALIFK
ncbi:MAG: HIT domain-containing protein [Halobacteria archaeon]